MHDYDYVLWWTKSITYDPEMQKRRAEEGLLREERLKYAWKRAEKQSRKARICGNLSNIFQRLGLSSPICSPCWSSAINIRSSRLSNCINHMFKTLDLRKQFYRESISGPSDRSSSFPQNVSWTRSRLSWRSSLITGPSICQINQVCSEICFWR